MQNSGIEVEQYDEIAQITQSLSDCFNTARRHFLHQFTGFKGIQRRSLAVCQQTYDQRDSVCALIPRLTQLRADNLLGRINTMLNILQHPKLTEHIGGTSLLRYLVQVIHANPALLAQVNLLQCSQPWRHDAVMNNSPFRLIRQMPLSISPGVGVKPSLEYRQFYQEYLATALAVWRDDVAAFEAKPNAPRRSSRR